MYYVTMASPSSLLALSLASQLCSALLDPTYLVASHKNSLSSAARAVQQQQRDRVWSVFGAGAAYYSQELFTTFPQFPAYKVIIGSLGVS